LERTWLETEITVDTVNWKGEPIQLSDVKAIKNVVTGEVLVHPSEIAKAEVRQIAECFNLQPRDVATLLMIQAKPGYFKEGEVFYKYHLQKLLFYLWKTLDKCGYGESLPVDHFVAAKNGPKPENLDADLQKLVEKKLITIKKEKWDNKESKRITLTPEGATTAEAIWKVLPDPYKEVAIKVKERIHPLTPDRVRHLVHNEYPEYKNTYTENDIE
jgi:DNA-binding PadR family transcriptional regulator